MYHMNIKSFMLVSAVSIAVASSGHSDAAQEIDSYMRALTALNRFSGTVLVAKANKILLNKGYGLASHEFNAPNRANRI